MKKRKSTLFKGALLPIFLADIEKQVGKNSDNYQIAILDEICSDVPSFITLGSGTEKYIAVP